MLDRLPLTTELSNRLFTRFEELYNTFSSLVAWFKRNESYPALCIIVRAFILRLPYINNIDEAIDIVNEKIFGSPKISYNILTGENYPLQVKRCLLEIEAAYQDYCKEELPKMKMHFDNYDAGLMFEKFKNMFKLGPLPPGTVWSQVLTRFNANEITLRNHKTGKAPLTPEALTAVMATHGSMRDLDYPFKGPALRDIALELISSKNDNKFADKMHENFRILDYFLSKAIPNTKAIDFASTGKDFDATCETMIFAEASALQDIFALVGMAWKELTSIFPELIKLPLGTILNQVLGQAQLSTEDLSRMAAYRTEQDNQLTAVPEAKFGRLLLKYGPKALQAYSKEDPEAFLNLLLEGVAEALMDEDKPPAALYMYDAIIEPLPLNDLDALRYLNKALDYREATEDEKEYLLNLRDSMYFLPALGGIFKGLFGKVLGKLGGVFGGSKAKKKKKKMEKALKKAMADAFKRGYTEGHKKGKAEIDVTPAPAVTSPTNVIPLNSPLPATSTSAPLPQDGLSGQVPTGQVFDELNVSDPLLDSLDDDEGPMEDEFNETAQ